MDRYISRAASLASEAGRMSQLITNQIVEKTKEVGVPGHIYDTADEKTTDIVELLDSRVN